MVGNGNVGLFWWCSRVHKNGKVWAVANSEYEVADVEVQDCKLK